MAQFKEFRRGYQPWEHGQGGGGDMGSSALDHDFVSTVGSADLEAGDPWVKVAGLIAESGYGSAGADSAAQATAAWLKAHGAKRVLEVGCGVGRGTRALAAGGFALRALDESPALVAAARAAAPGVVVEEGSLTEPAGGSFDAVVSVIPAFSRLTLAGQPESFLEAARAGLAPGGLLSFVFYNRDGVDEEELCKVYLRGPFTAGGQKMVVYDQWKPHQGGGDRFVWVPLFAPGDYSINWCRRSIPYRFWHIDDVRHAVEAAGFEQVEMVDADQPASRDTRGARQVLVRARAK